MPDSDNLKLDMVSRPKRKAGVGMTDEQHTINKKQFTSDANTRLEDRKQLIFQMSFLEKGEKVLKSVSPLANKIKYQHHMHFKKILTITFLEGSHFMPHKKRLLAKLSGLPNYSATHVIMFCSFFFCH